ncbi:gibberellin-regulated protein 14-like [Salvia divinorum]|uniref:Gibberellin-regulated protein 14-like n=1 Tax=Salvia divinorum TaxID=28513 RepID=A0ABD1HDQ6_SALDI
MASKWFIFMLAFVLLVTRMVSSAGDVENIETENNDHRHHEHAKAPASAPVYTPLHAPAKAPIHHQHHEHATAPAHAPLPHHHHHHKHVTAPAHAPLPHHHHEHAPVHTPLHAPAKAPAASTQIPPPHGCVAQCASYCKPVSPKRPCMKKCTLCCAKCKCVPGSTKCHNWNSVEIHGHLVKCP